MERALTSARHTLFRHDDRRHRGHLGRRPGRGGRHLFGRRRSRSTPLRSPPRPGPPRHRRRLAPQRARAARPPTPLPHLRHPARPVWETDGKPVSVGRATRTVPHRARVVIENRDRGCRVPGCPRTLWLHIHHLTHWEDGGNTDTNNLIALCAHHHRLHHGHIGIQGNADHPNGVTFTYQGRILANHAPAPTTRRTHPHKPPNTSASTPASGNTHSANPSTPTGSTSANHHQPHPTDARVTTPVASFQCGTSGGRDRAPDDTASRIQIAAAAKAGR